VPLRKRLERPRRFTIRFKPGKELRDMAGPVGEPAAKAADFSTPASGTRS